MSRRSIAHVLHLRDEFRIEELRRVATGAETKPIDDVVAVYLLADLLEERRSVGIQVETFRQIGLARMRRVGINGQAIGGQRRRQSGRDR